MSSDPIASSSEPRYRLKIRCLAVQLARMENASKMIRLAADACEAEERTVRSIHLYDVPTHLAAVIGALRQALDAAEEVGIRPQEQPGIKTALATVMSPIRAVNYRRVRPRRNRRRGGKATWLVRAR